MNDPRILPTPKLVGGKIGSPPTKLEPVEIDWADAWKRSEREFTKLAKRYIKIELELERIKKLRQNYARRHDYKTSEAYHNAPGFSRSQMVDALTSPSLFYQRHISGEIDKKDSASMAFGRMAHEAIINRRGIMRGVKLIAKSALASDGSRRGPKWKIYKEKFADRVLVNEREWNCLKHIADAVGLHKAARRLIKRGVDSGGIEAGLEWVEKVEMEDGSVVEIPLRAQLDVLLDDAIVDFKTSRAVDAEGFAMSAARYRYHYQAAFYRRAVRRLVGDELPFLMIAAQTEAPFDVAVYELNDEDGGFLSTGEAMLERSLRIVARGLKFNTWAAPSHGSVVSLAAPGFLRFSEEWNND